MREYVDFKNELTTMSGRIKKEVIELADLIGWDEDDCCKFGGKDAELFWVDNYEEGFSMHVDEVIVHKKGVITLMEDGIELLYEDIENIEDCISVYQCIYKFVADARAFL